MRVPYQLPSRGVMVGRPLVLLARLVLVRLVVVRVVVVLVARLALMRVALVLVRVLPVRSRVRSRVRELAALQLLPPSSRLRLSTSRRCRACWLRSPAWAPAPATRQLTTTCLVEGPPTPRGGQQVQPQLDSLSLAPGCPLLVILSTGPPCHLDLFYWFCCVTVGVQALVARPRTSRG